MPDPSIPVAAVRALAQGEPLDEVASDYGVDTEVVREVAPLVGRCLHPEVTIIPEGFLSEADADVFAARYREITGQ